MFNLSKKVNLGFWKDVKKPAIVLAPMAEVTDVAFRQILAKYGKPDVTWTEFVSCDGLVKAPQEFLQRAESREQRKRFSPQEIIWRDLLYFENERPIVAQVFSANPKMMEQGAFLVTRAGFDGIDINMGCPDRSIQKQGAGAALIKDPDLAVKIIKAAKKGIKRACKEMSRQSSTQVKKPEIPLSVKTRLGYNKDTMEEWLTVLLQQKLAVITLHARTKKEMSKVPAKWNRIADLVKLRDKISPETLIIGNGDVKDLEDANQKVEETGCDGVMIGRGVFGNPWTFNRSLGGGERIDLRNRLEVMIEHTKLFEKYLPHKNFNIMKKHFKAYVNKFKGAKELREKLMEAPSANAVEHITRDWVRNNLT